MTRNYSARIIENGKVRQAECIGSTPEGALLGLVMAVHIRKGAIIKLGCAYWLGDNFVRHVYEYHHIPERDLFHASAWELVGSDYVRYIPAKPE
nr:MAG TPA: hypothetical protein [Caudoviricetes sp.]